MEYNCTRVTGHLHLVHSGFDTVVWIWPARPEGSSHLYRGKRVNVYPLRPPPVFGYRRIRHKVRVYTVFVPVP
eukprot:1162987-Rhodomonas_salina.1